MTPASVFLDGEEIDIRLVPDGQPVNDAGDLESIFARTSDGSIIPLSSVTSFEQKLNQSSFAREGGQLAVSIQSNLAPGFDLGQAVSRMYDVAFDVLPDDAGITLLGEAAELDEGRQGTFLVFGLAGLIVFLVLGRPVRKLHQLCHYHADRALRAGGSHAGDYHHGRHAELLQHDRAGGC